MAPVMGLKNASFLKCFIRSIGLDIINTIAVRSRKTSEPPKQAIVHSRLISLSRCALHIALIAVFSFLLFLNFRAGLIVTIPPESEALIFTLFQVSAKILEIMCVACLTAIVVHVLRYELIQDGVPLGLVGSGLYFSQANYFWSPEMLAGALHCLRDWRRNWRVCGLFALVSVSAILALLIGPSSAVLLMPRTQQLPAGGTTYYLPGGQDKFWPWSLNETDVPPECYSDSASLYSPCPSGGYDVLRAEFQSYAYRFADGPGSARAIFSRIYAGDFSLRMVNNGQVAGSARDTVIQQPHALSALFQTVIGRRWLDVVTSAPKTPLSPFSHYRDAPETQLSTSSPYPLVHVKCSIAQNVSATNTMMVFPVKSWTTRKRGPDELGSAQWEDGLKPFNVSSALALPSDQLRVDWSPLPVDDFGPVSGAAIITFPGSQSNTSHLAVGCSVSASWYYGPIKSSTRDSNGLWTFREDQDLDRKIVANASSSPSSQPDSSHNRLINIDPGWFRALNTPVSCLNCNSTNNSTFPPPPGVLSALLLGSHYQRAVSDLRTDPAVTSCTTRLSPASASDVDLWNEALPCGVNGFKVILLEWMLAATFADGLSRHALQRAFLPGTTTYIPGDAFRGVFTPINYSSPLGLADPSPRRKENPIQAPPEGSNFVAQSMNVDVSGYAYYAGTSTSDFLLAAVVLVYMLVTAAYVLWVVLVRGETGGCWDTVTELLALALKSPAVAQLEGTGAGIEVLGTYKRIVKVRARSRDGIVEAEGEESGNAEEIKSLVFVVDEEKHPSAKEEGDGEDDGIALVANKAPISTAIEDNDSHFRNSSGARYRRIALGKKYL